MPNWASPSGTSSDTASESPKPKPLTWETRSGSAQPPPECPDFCPRYFSRERRIMTERIFEVSRSVMEAMMLDRIVEVFCEVDDFCQAFLPQWEASLLSPGGPAPRGPHVAQRDHHASACAPQFRLQTSQELLS